MRGRETGHGPSVWYSSLGSLDKLFSRYCPIALKSCRLTLTLTLSGHGGGLGAETTWACLVKVILFSFITDVCVCVREMDMRPLNKVGGAWYGVI